MPCFDFLLTRLFYDESGNVIKSVSPRNYNPQDDDGAGITYIYDGANRVVEIRDPLGVIIEQNEYNNAGELIAKTDASKNSIEYKYDIGGRLKEIYTLGAKQKGMAAQQYMYDAIGNVTAIKDGEGNATNYTLDLWGRITEVYKADGTTEKYAYDYAGNITSSTVIQQSMSTTV